MKYVFGSVAWNIIIYLHAIHSSKYNNPIIVNKNRKSHILLIHNIIFPMIIISINESLHETYECLHPDEYNSPNSSKKSDELIDLDKHVLTD
jgi:hypothetical protein